MQLYFDHPNVVLLLQNDVSDVEKVLHPSGELQLYIITRPKNTHTMIVAFGTIFCLKFPSSE